MTQRSTLNYFLLLGIMGFALACSKHEPDANPVPSIGFKAIHKVTLTATTKQARRDSVIITIEYSDGDGDLGEDARDSTRLKAIFSNQTWGNYQIRAFQLEDNQFKEMTSLPTPKLFVDLGKGATRPQIGTIDYKQLFPYTSTYKRLPVKFQLRMRDRKLHESNVIETDTISLPISQ